MHVVEYKPVMSDDYRPSSRPRQRGRVYNRGMWKTGTVPMAVIVCVGLLAAGAYGQADQTEPSLIDECGTLVQGNGCVLFEGAGGKYVVPDAGRFDFGDSVRIVGTLDPSCITICKDSDGCIRGAELYDPATFPCGVSLPNFPEDIVTNACASASTGLLTIALAGIWYTRRGMK